MASANYKASPPFIFHSTQQEVMLIMLLLVLCLALMMPFITSATTPPITPSTGASDSNTKGCIKEERDALLAFTAEIIYPKAHPISSWGDHTDDCCQWASVVCDNISGHVVRLKLQCKHPPTNDYGFFDFCDERCGSELCLSGNISQSLLGLRHLRYLDLSFNCFESISIPKLLGSLENLVHLDLSYSCYTGVIPHELGNLTRLHYLNLAPAPDVFSYKVDDAEWLSGLSSLRYLFMPSVNFSGVNNVMQSLNKLRHLKHVSLPGCIMSSIPESLPYLSFPSLTVMDMRAIMFDKYTSIPEWLFRIPNLRDLTMRHCGLIGTIPSSAGNATSLQSLDLSYNGGISGHMPRGFGKLCNLQLLGLDGTFVGNSLEDFRDAFSECIRQNLNFLSFRESSLKGPLPDWFGEFRNLTFLDLSFNSLHSSIPESFGRLSLLQQLDLGSNDLNSCIPESLGRLSGLQYLNLGNNILKGSIPESLGRLSGLQDLDLGSNILKGSIPESLGKLSELQDLDLGGNDLNGPVPKSLSQLSNLYSMDLSYNFNFSDSVITEAHLANFTSLKYLILDHTNLVLNISTDWIPRFSAERISLSYCNIGPKFPVWLANQVNLDLLDISNTGIKDSIPDWFWNITYTMSTLNLSNNEINGQLPQRLKFQAEKSVNIFLNSNCFEGSVPYFHEMVFALDLSNNSLSGIIPSDLGNFGGTRSLLKSLSLSSNKLTGNIPNSLCNFEELVLLELSNNHLEGAIPNCWNNSTDLQFLVLANNSLAGEIPNSLISSSQVLQVLHLSNNRLHGNFPSFLKKCSSMTTLALDHNNLSGNIPTWVGETMTSLMILTLKENNFSGNLPLLSNLTSLHFLDFSHNSFVGSMPQSYGNLIGMKSGSMNGGASFSSNISEVLVITMTLSKNGIDLEYGVILSSFKFMDLSANKLSGQIPKEIVNLVGLQNFDLSCNHLSGEIPRNIGLMQSLESLDLSRNELVGSIPLGLSTLHFLGSLNLSYNMLSGKIPYANQLTTFNDPSIYAGNLNLCGAPLDKNCTSDEPHTHDQENDDDNDNLAIWLDVGLMPGFVVGFWTVWGILLFKKVWRHVYFRFLDHMYDIMYVKIVVIVPKIKRALVVIMSM